MLTAEDGGGLVADLLRMLKDKEIAEALERVEQARRAQADASFSKRSEGVGVITRAMTALKRQREQLREGIAALPEDVRLDAEHLLMPLIQDVFDMEIARLRSAKRRLSRQR